MQPNRLLLVAFALLFAGTPLLATPANQVRTRVEGLRALGAAFKTVNDGLRSSDVPVAQIQQAARTIRTAARQQYRWFPAGSGPQTGVKTYAKPDIWSKRAEFRTAQDNFARAADGFQRAAATGNVDAIKAANRNLGGTCKACHDAFRTPKD